MTHPTKLDAALMMAPFDITATLVALGADLAFTWTGVEPVDREVFFIELGRRVAAMAEAARDREAERMDRRA